eukprot:TRINITY_DN12790_c0_g1_i1.p1 TRINITY_DN12790_c0_g1~~TRINITY_DN12790_c0_g1_i1.p1  ORF type:complete len:138 (+),score=16.08 TRINITY_DN12790_c0_g1_i1:38-415(+)
MEEMNEIYTLNKVEGYTFKYNNIICKINNQYDYDHTIIFGGDIQDSEDKMKGEDANWTEYSHENTVGYISGKFPKSHVWLIQPARKTGSYSEFDNLTSPGLASVHLHHLLINAIKSVAKKKQRLL